DGNGSHASTLKSPSYTKSVSWQHYPVSFLRGFVASKKNAFRRRFLPPEICLFCDVIQGIQKEVRTTPDMCYQALFDGLILTKDFVTIIE
ncbi:hypothetical protein MZE61_17975, partial [Escherichia coli]|nr:hypothetical protein [Escherichia coli]